jgi:hypothetical protein
MLQALVCMAALAAPVPVGSISEPSEPPAPPEAATAPQEPNDDLYHRVLRYRHDQLEVKAVEKPQQWATPLTLTPPGALSRDNQPGFGAGYPTPAPLPADAPDWGIVRGGIEPLDETDLARLLGDDALLHGIEDARRQPRIIWGAALGSVAAATLGTGGWLVLRSYPDADAHRDGRAIGMSLLTVGAAAAVLAWFYPGHDHVLTPQEAAYKCDAYNDGLRRDLGLAPEDLRRY